MLPRKCRAKLLHEGVVLETFDRLHGTAVALNGIRDAGASRVVVDQHGARPAHAVLASEMSSREPAMLAQKISQMSARLDQCLDLPPVHTERDRHHNANTCANARLTAAAAIACSTASRSPTACVSASLTASTEVALSPCFATCCANDVSDWGTPRSAPRKMRAAPDSGSNTAAALASANSPVLRQNL